jgi:cysteine-rich repeat protein
MKRLLGFCGVLAASVCVSACSSDSSDDGSAGSDTSATGGEGIYPPGCGDGVVEGDEVCDDGNNVTEPAPHDPGACMADCSMVLATCGNGVVDEGEQCDDGNQDSMDDCTTSCTTNDHGLHAPCSRSTTRTDMDVTSGEIEGCENVEVPENMELSCVLSQNFYNVTLVYAAEGDCQTIALACDGGACPPTAGDYDADISCPAGAVLVEKEFEGPFEVVVRSKVCQKACESDAECRWNAHDEFWDAPGRYRCEITPYSKGKRVCNDGQSNEND